jgi:hypothetical protein
MNENRGQLKFINLADFDNTVEAERLIEEFNQVKANALN